MEKLYSLFKGSLIKKIFLASLTCLALTSFFLVTNGHIMPVPDMLDEVFLNMWQHIRLLDISISPSIASGEAYVVNGKITMYFLPLPALVRGILSLFGLGSSATTSIVLASTVFGFFSCLVYLLLLKITTSGEDSIPVSVEAV